MVGILIRCARSSQRKLTKIFLAGLPRIWFGCHVIDRAYVRTYSPTDCTGRVGETIKRKGGVSQGCLGVIIVLDVCF